MIQALLFSYNKIQQLIPVIIEGMVLDKKSGRPISNAWVHVVSGEEAITDTNGEFLIKSWQPVPLNLFVEHGEYETTIVTVSSLAKKLVIQLC